MCQQPTKVLWAVHMNNLLCGYCFGSHLLCLVLFPNIARGVPERTRREGLQLPVVILHPYSYREFAP